VTYAHVFYVYAAAFAVFAVYCGFRQHADRGMVGLRYPFAFFITAFAGWFLYPVSRHVELNISNPATWLMCFLIFIGGGGCLSSALSAMGPLKLPASYEWPAGYVRGVVTTPDGKYIVPLWAAGRIQVYDSQLRFRHGWNVDAWGGPFRLRCPTNGVIEVYPLRGELRYSFTDEGQLISSERDELPGPPLPKGQSLVVPTHPLLWIFSSPILSGAVAAIGLAGLGALNRIGR
jgi:hypothetical protein